MESELTWTLRCGLILTLWLGTMAVPVTAADQDIEALICQYDWDCAKAIRVAFCESTLNPRAENVGQIGLFQIAYRWHSRRVESADALYDPETNIRIAHQIWREQSWAPWPHCGLR